MSTKYGSQGLAAENQTADPDDEHVVTPDELDVALQSLRSDLLGVDPIRDSGIESFCSTLTALVETMDYLTIGAIEFFIADRMETVDDIPIRKYNQKNVGRRQAAAHLADSLDIDLENIDE